MNILAPVFLWLLPLALIPVIIHLLNRLRYQTVHWAAMMFLRQADRESTRRAKLRQWWILAMRVLVLLAFLGALLRPLYEGTFARFFGAGADVVIIAFDRSASMETAVSGLSARERSLALLQTALEGRGPQSRTYFMDSVTREMLPVGPETDLAELPTAAASSAPGRMLDLLQHAVSELAAQSPLQAEIWLATDLQASDWVHGHDRRIQVPETLQSRLRIRMMDVGHSPEGNRAIRLTGAPVFEGDRVRLRLQVLRQPGAPEEELPVWFERDGIRLRKDVRINGDAFEWEEVFDTEESGNVVLTAVIPDDSNPQDNHVYISIPPPGQQHAEVVVGSRTLDRICRAGLLPAKGIRQVESVDDAQRAPTASVALRIQDREPANDPSWEQWLSAGGVCLVLPEAPDGRLRGEDREGEEAFAVAEWDETTGPLRSFAGNEGLRLDLLQVHQRVELDVREGVDVLARHADESPFLTREVKGNGSVYQLSTLPYAEWSGIGAGYLWVPILQRLLGEGVGSDRSQGTHDLGSWTPLGRDEWRSDAGLRIEQDAGLYRSGARLLALNTPAAEMDRVRIDAEEVKELCGEVPVEVFRDESPEEQVSSRVELAHGLAFAGLFFLLIESLLVLYGAAARQRRSPVQHAATSQRGGVA